MMSDPRTALTSDPRPPCDPRTMLSVCTCGLPNCPRVPHHPTTHPMTLAQEGHLAATHGLSGLPIGSPPVGHVDPALLYQMGAAYGLPESPDVMRALPQLGGYYPYDPSSVYPYMNGYAGIDARRKNATKESTNTLKAWLFEHRKNPYPTKGEKIMLAILTKMTLTQVSTWFANARRRLKKENKVTWVTKDDVIGDDDEDDDADSERNSDVGDHVTGSGGAGGDGAAAGDNMRHHGSVGDEDDNMSVLSAGDRSEIDVEENSEVGDDVEPDVGRGTADVTGPLPAAVYAGKPSQSACSTTSARTDNSDQSQRENDNSTTREANASPITPPPSPRTSQSTCSSQTTPTSVHQSTATIHHHPVTSANSTPMSSKPKIWSIADVVSSKEASDRTETRPEVTSAACRPLAFGPSKCIGAPSAIVSIGGAPVRQYGCTESPYSFAYYPYTLPHTAMMTSQAAAVAASHVRLAAHPYSMPAHAHSSPSATHLISPASGLERPLSGQSAFVRATAQLTPSVGGTNDSTKATENNNKQASQGQADTKCSTSVFMPVTQRQV